MCQRLCTRVIHELLGVRNQRREFFERLISPKIPPSTGYRSLARILNEGWVSTILTTNFDRCLESARVLENKPHLLVSIKTPDDLVRFSTAPMSPQLIYLHGSVEHYSDKNLLDEVAELDRLLVGHLTPLVRDHPVVVVGYRGSERSIMKGLFLDLIDASNQFAKGIYWCVRQDSSEALLAPMVDELASAIGANFQLVPVKGFDELLDRELWARLVADHAPPLRRERGIRQIELPADMRVLDGSDTELFDKKTLFYRLTQYGRRLGLRVLEHFDSDWLEQEAHARNLLIDDNGDSRPTLAGWLLFAINPQSIVPQASVTFRADGPAHWITSCFGNDYSTAAPDSDGELTVEQNINGNLWAQLDSLTDILAMVNLEFRLKGEVSRTAYPFDPIALKETVVNALVHRSYDRKEPIVVNVTPEVSVRALHVDRLRWPALCEPNGALI